MSYYLCKYNDGNLLPIKGPMRSQEVVDLIISKGDLEAQAPYCNASRYELAKLGLYPRNKAGDNKLLTDIAANSAETDHQKKGVKVYQTCSACGHTLPANYFDHAFLCYLCDTEIAAQTLKRQ